MSDSTSQTQAAETQIPPSESSETQPDPSTERTILENPPHDDVPEPVSNDHQGEPQVNADVPQESTEGDGADKDDAGENKDGEDEPEGEESGGEVSEEDEDDKEIRRSKKSSKFIDFEAEVSSDEEVSDDEDEDDDDLIDDGEGDDGFVEDETDERERRAHKKRIREEEEKEDELAEDDYALIEENTGFKVQKSVDADIDVSDGEDNEAQGGGRKRLKKVQTSAPILVRNDAQSTTRRSKAAEGDDGPSELADFFDEDDDGNQAEEPDENDDAAALEEDNDRDFEPSRPVSKKAAKGGTQSKRREKLFDLFGSVAKFFQERKGVDDMDDEDEEDLERQERLAAASKAKKKTAKDISEEMESKIRNSDIPERLHYRLLKRGSEWSREKLILDIPIEAAWIYSTAFSRDKSERDIIPIISRILEFIRLEHVEIPYIALYKKDIWGGKDYKSTLSEDDLYTIDSLDETYDEYSGRRDKLLWMLEKLAHDDEEVVKFITRELQGPHDLEDIQDYVKFLSVMRGIGVGDDQEVKLLTSASQSNSQPQSQLSQSQSQPQSQPEPSQASIDPSPSQSQESSLPIPDPSQTNSTLPSSVPPSQPAPSPDGGDGDEKEFDFNAPSNSPSRPVPSSSVSTVARKGRHIKRVEFSLARVATSLGLDKLSDKIGIAPRQLGENLRLHFRKHEPVDVSYTLDNDLLQYLGGRYSSTDSLLRILKSFTALRISVDPVVRRAIRRLYNDKAEINTRPTPKGVREIDSDTHDYWSVKRIERKPVIAFHRNPAQYMLILKAQKEGFIHIDIKIPDRGLLVDHFADEFSEPEKNPIIGTLQEMFLSTARNDNAKKWNVHRREILQEAFRVYLAKIGENHVKAFLLRQASDSIVEGAQAKLRHLITAGGFQPAAPITRDDDSKSQSQSRSRQFKVFGICMGSTNEPSGLAILNRYGHVLEVAVMHFLKSRAQAVGRNGRPLDEGERSQYKRKQEDATEFMRLINVHKPALIVIDASDLEGRDFRDEIAKRAQVDHPSVLVEFMDPTAARIYVNSARAEMEFKEHPKLLRTAISLGRRALDPLAELSGIWQSSDTADSPGTSNHGSMGMLANAGLLNQKGPVSATVAAATNPLKNDILALLLHPLQSTVPQSHLLKALATSFIRVVNAVGVDINKIVTRPWLCGVMQFLCGLGTIKGKHLLDLIKRQGYLPSREDLIEQYEGESPLVGPVIYRCAAGFIKVTQNSAMSEQKFNNATLVDETRIHPERYDLAYQIVRDSLDIEDNPMDDIEDDDDDDDNSSRRRKKKKAESHLEKAKRRNAAYAARLMHPDEISKIDQLDFEAFAEMSRNELGNILDILLLIKQEFRQPFSTEGILRPYTPPTTSELFYLLTGESSRTLREGMMVTVQVNGTNPRGAHVKLDSGIPGFLPVFKISDNPPSRDLDKDATLAWIRERLNQGMALDARIIRIDKEHVSVELSTTSRDKAHWEPRDRDRVPTNPDDDVYACDHYSFKGTHPEDKTIISDGKVIKRSKFIQRNINHILFKNVDRIDALKDLAPKLPGDMVIRPSSKGSDRLIITWKVYEDIYGDVEIREDSKPSTMEIGSVLKIGDQSFEDLDEVIERFMNKMARSGEAMIAHKNFRMGDAADMDVILRAEKSQFPRKIPYTISFSLDANLAFKSFVFSYLPHQNIKTERVYLSNDGFVFNKKKFKNPDHVIGALKQFIAKGPEAAKPLPPPSSSRAGVPSQMAPYSAYQPPRPMVPMPPQYPPPHSMSMSMGPQHPMSMSMPPSIPSYQSYNPYYPPQQQPLPLPSSSRWGPDGSSYGMPSGPPQSMGPPMSHYATTSGYGAYYPPQPPLAPPPPAQPQQPYNTLDAMREQRLRERDRMESGRRGGQGQGQGQYWR